MTPAIYRKSIRAALNKAAPFAVPEETLEEVVEAMIGGAFDVSTYRDAIEWSVAQDYTRRSTNADTDGREWSLTKLGKAKADQD